MSLFEKKPLEFMFLKNSIHIVIPLVIYCVLVGFILSSYPLMDKISNHKITELSDLKEAITAYTVEAIKKLRKDHLLCGTVTVFLQSNPFDTSQPYYNKSLSHNFTEISVQVKL